MDSQRAKGHAPRSGGEEMALYLPSLPRDEDSPPLNLDTRMGDEHDSMPLLTVAVITGMVRVVEAIIGLGADLRARDARGHLAVCHAVNVVNVLLEAHAKFFLGVGMVLECPCRQVHGEKGDVSLLFHALEKTGPTLHPRLDGPWCDAYLRGGAQRFGARLQTIFCPGTTLSLPPLATLTILWSLSFWRSAAWTSTQLGGARRTQCYTL